MSNRASWRARPLAALALLLLVMLPACRGGGGDGGASAATDGAVDTQEVESLLVSTQQRASPEFDVRDPSCPARIVVEEGATFQCTVVVEGVVAPFNVTLRGVNEGSRTGQFDIRPAKAILSIPKLVDVLRARVPGATVDCGPERVRVLDVGATFQCRVSGGSQPEQTITLRVDDVLGNVTQV
ncbi:MAG TPA: DUF4333 domain-containing protein [Acidimicrobiales bacterium]|jgi:hypothetical protein|nr:DUF4333 domain-containing protein [Acidimicrobiales bacterium]